MSRTKDVKKYPKQYLDIVDKVAAGQQAKLVLADEKQARKLRGQWYAFVQAMQKAQTKLEQTRLTRAREEKQLGKPITELDQELVVLEPRIVALSRIVCFQEGPLVRWSPTTETWQAKAMETGLKFEETKAGEKLQDAAAESEARMQKLLEETQS